MKQNVRKIFVVIVLIVCIIAINIAIYAQVTRKPKQENKQEIQIDTATLTENFNNLFDNTCSYQENMVFAQKEDSTRDIIYTYYTNQTSVDEQYEMNVSIPYFNINSSTAKKMNQEINQLFYSKAKEVLVNSIEHTIYNVKYKAYVNDNILSLVINATLKEGKNPQRIIMKTYNYNLSSHSALTLKEILQYRNIKEETAQNTIIDTVKKASEDASKYYALGYSKYLRDIHHSMYQIDHTTVYFLGEGKALYIIYAYGNFNYTSEMDLIVM